MVQGKPIDQGRQVSASYVYDDQRAAGATMESVPVVLEDNVNDLRTLARLTTGEDHWYIAPTTGSLKEVSARVTVIEAVKLNASDHAALRQLAHFIDEGPGGGFASGAVRVDSPSGHPFPDRATWYADATMTAKLVEQVVTRAANVAQITTSTWTIYAEDGVTPLESVTDSFTYEGASPYPLTRTRTIT